MNLGRVGSFLLETLPRARIPAWDMTTDDDAGSFTKSGGLHRVSYSLL